MKAQTAFNRVWQWFIVEEKPPGSARGFCTYFDPVTGVRCAVGCLLPPEVAADELSGGLAEVWASLPGAVKQAGFELLLALQAAHDTAADHRNFPDELRLNLIAVARAHALIVPEEKR